LFNQNIFFSEYRKSLNFKAFWKIYTSLAHILRPDREADCPSPSSTELKNEWSYTTAPLYACMAWRGTALP